MDLYFKIEQAHEEIPWLNVKIQWVVTYIHDEDHFLHYWETKVSETNTQLALHIKLYHMEHGHFNPHHKHWIHDIMKLKGFSGNILPGMSTATGPGKSVSVWALMEADSASTPLEDADTEDGDGEDAWADISANQQEADDEVEADLAMEELIHGIASVMQASLD